MKQVISKALTSENFDYDMTDGFRMGVEKEWHKIAPLAPLKTTDIYDLNGNKLDATNYGISIWIKAVVPLSHFADSGVTENDLKIPNNQQYASFVNATGLGIPVNAAGNSDGNWVRDYVQLNMFRTGLPVAYSKPTNINTTGVSNSAFAEGRDNTKATTYFKIDNNDYKVSNDSTYLQCSNSYPDRLLCTAISVKDGLLLYTIDTSNININLTGNFRFVIPELFTVFGQIGAANGNNKLDKFPCWFLICLGVDKVQ